MKKNGLIEYPDGAKEWYKNGKLHREDGYPAVEYPDGIKEWYLNGKIHRADGPAIEYPNGTNIWCLNGKLHRTDGPAIECQDGSKGWWLNDQSTTPSKLIELYPENEGLILACLFEDYFIRTHTMWDK